MRSLTKLDMSDDRMKINGRMVSALGSPTWDVRSFKRQNKRKQNLHNSMTRMEDTFSDEIKSQINTSKIDNSLAQAFVNECETLEEVVSNLLKEINQDKTRTDKNKQEK